MEDLISRKALLEKFKSIGLGENSFIERVFADGVFVVIENAPAVEAEPVRHSELLEKIKQLEQERNAAIRDCARFPCYTCNERENGDFCPQCRATGTFRALHEWRGVCPENSPDCGAKMDGGKANV